MASVSHLESINKYKLVFVGDESVGKSSIITKFMYNKFEHIYQKTYGMDFFSRSVKLEDRTIRLLLWDLAGQERFRGLMQSYITDSSFAVIVYDVTNRQSFLNISKYWIKEVRAVRGSDAVIVLVGNKTDLVDERQVSIEEGEGIAREFREFGVIFAGVIFVETSAKDGFNIKLLFKSIESKIQEKYGPPDNNPSGRSPSNLGDQQPSPEEDTGKRCPSQTEVNLFGDEGDWVILDKFICDEGR